MSGLRLALIVAVLCFIVPVACEAQVAGAAPAPRAVLDKYCVTCHNQRAKTAGLALDALDLAHVTDRAEVWEKVVRKIRTGAMPPAGLPRPDKALADDLVSWLETELDRAALKHPNPGRPTLHRLNRAEYSNAIRDLLALEIDAASLLPADNAGHGFDNNADALSLSAALTERYLEAAAKISQMALGRVWGSSTPATVFVPTDRDQTRRFNDDLPWGSRGGLAFRYYFPVDGEYVFQIRLKQSGVAGGFVGVSGEPHQLDVSLDDFKVWTSTLGGPEFTMARGMERGKKILEALQLRVPVKAGSHQVQVYFVAKTSAFVEDLFDPYQRREPYRANSQPEISSVTMTAPSANDAAGANDSPSRRRLFVCRPAAAPNEGLCANKIIASHFPEWEDYWFKVPSPSQEFIQVCGVLVLDVELMQLAIDVPKDAAPLRGAQRCSCAASRPAARNFGPAGSSTTTPAAWPWRWMPPECT